MNNDMGLRDFDRLTTAEKKKLEGLLDAEISATARAKKMTDRAPKDEAAAARTG